MDPTANLNKQLQLAQLLNNDGEKYLTAQEGDEAGAELAALVQALDTWIINGGALPEQWRPKAEL